MKVCVLAYEAEHLLVVPLRAAGHDVRSPVVPSEEAWDWIRAAEAVVLVSPAGNGRLLWFGWACGARKITVALVGPGAPAFLSMADRTVTDIDAVVEFLAAAAEVPS